MLISIGVKVKKTKWKVSKLKKRKEDLKNLENIICLKKLDLQIEKGSLVSIIGEFGSGKSSFLSALIGDLKYLTE